VLRSRTRGAILPLP